MADYMNVSKKLSRAAFTTSDKGASLLWSRCSDSNRDMVMREYIYIKSAMAVWLLKGLANELPEHRRNLLEAANEVRLILMDSCQYDFAGYHCNAVTLNDVIDKGSGSSGPGMFAYLLYSNTNGVIGLMDCDTACRLAYEHLCLAAQSKSSGGCLSTIACMVAVAAALCVLM